MHFETFVNFQNTPRQNWLIIRRKVISSFYIFSIDTSTSKSARKFLKGVIIMFMVLKRFFSIRAIQSTSNHDLTTSRKCFLRGIVMQYKNQIFYLETYFSSQKFIISTILRRNDFFKSFENFFFKSYGFDFCFRMCLHTCISSLQKMVDIRQVPKIYSKKNEPLPQMGV